MLPKIQRLTVKEIEGLVHGKSVFGALISIRLIPGDKLKFAVAVSKKVAKTAVERNKIRRRVYSLLRLVQKDIKKPFFIMLMPKKEFLDSPLDVLNNEISLVFKKAGLL